MAEVKLTKNELRLQQCRLQQLQKYLPTLQLKKAMLQAEVQAARQEIVDFRNREVQAKAKIERYVALFADGPALDLASLIQVANVSKRYENIAGVEVPYLDAITFAPCHYPLADTPIWLDAALLDLRALTHAKAAVDVAEEKKASLEKEWQEVSIRVNLFEKILIPRAERHIKKIRIFLGDQQLAAVSQAKVAKAKIAIASMSTAESMVSARSRLCATM